MSARSIRHPEIVLSFDKDDDDTLDFVLATANLRAIAYGIETKTRFQVKGNCIVLMIQLLLTIPAEMAGNIIPAIATTNAIIAGFVVMKAVNLLTSDTITLKNVYLKAEPAKPLGIYNLQPPDPSCAVCRDVYLPFKVDLARCTLREFVLDVVGKWLMEGINGQANGNEEMGVDTDGRDVEWEVLEGKRVLADPDFDDNHARTLEDLGVDRGMMLTVLDEDERYRPIHFCICAP